MSESKDSSVLSQVIAGVIVAALIGSVSFFSGALTAIGGVASLIFNHLRGTSEVPNWISYLLASISLTSLTCWITRSIRTLRKPTVTSYNQDNILGTKWRWSYINGIPSHIRPICPHCEQTLVYSEGQRYDPNQDTILSCENCNKDLLIHHGDYRFLIGRITREIARIIETGAWQQRISKPQKMNN